VGGSTGNEGGSSLPGGTGGAASTAGTGGAAAGTGGATTGTGGATTGTGGAPAGAGGAAAGAGGAAANEIILFDGSDESFNGWVSLRNGGPNPWKNNGDGTMTPEPTAGDIESKQKFGDVFVHLEYMAPPEPNGDLPEVDGSANVLLHQSYGLRITDSYGLPPRDVSCGSVFGYHAPLEVACHEHGTWNTFDIEFQAPTCSNESPGAIATPARFVEVRLNGTLIHRNVDVLQPTQAGAPASCERRSLRIMPIGSTLPTSFRNIWAIPRN
jgi:hypothetical protein